MKQYLIIFSFLFVHFFSFSQEEIKFELLNENLEYNINPDSLGFYKRAYNDYEKKMSNNIVKYKLQNNTSKKYLFLIKDNFLKHLFNIEINFFENDSLIQTIKRSVIEPYTKDFEEFKTYRAYDQFVDDIYNERDIATLKMGFSKSEFENRFVFFSQYIVVYPNESIVLFSSVHIPYIVEENWRNLGVSIFADFKRDKHYEFSLKYKLKEDIEKILPNEILDNLKENNIEIFKGEIETQRIPIINIFEQ